MEGEATGEAAGEAGSGASEALSAAEARVAALEAEVSAGREAASASADELTAAKSERDGLQAKVAEAEAAAQAAETRAAEAEAKATGVGDASANVLLQFDVRDLVDGHAQGLGGSGLGHRALDHGDDLLLVVRDRKARLVEVGSAARRAIWLIVVVNLGAEVG